jgi:signal transduction histidine kinase
MDRPFRPFQTGNDADVAFAVVVLASYFTTFSGTQDATTFELLLMIGLGIAYIAMGIYGYAFVARSGKLTYHLAYFTIQFLLGGSIVFLGKGVGFNAMVLLPLAGHSVMLLPRSLRLVVNIGIVLTYALALNPFTANNWGNIWSGLPMFLAGQIFIVAFTQMAVSEEKARSEVEQLVDELEEVNQRLREFAMQVEELATTKERNRLAREIHDGLGHYLTTIYMQIQAARAVMKKDLQKSQEALGTAQNLTQEALVDVRRSVAALRDMPNDSFSLHEEVEKMLKGAEGSGISSEMKVLGSPRVLTPQTLLTMYRAVQEGINNTCKHAHASRLSVIIDYTQSSQVKLVLQDDGVGAGQMDGGFGLLGMRERVHLLKGEMTVITGPNDGFRLEISVPG